MLDTILNIGSIFNWITPLFAFIRDLISGPVGDFGIPSRVGWYQEDIRWLMKNHDIPVWGLMYDFKGEILMFTVNANDAPLAFEIFENAGVPLLYVPSCAFR